MPPPLEGLSPEAEKEAHRDLYDARVAEQLWRSAAARVGRNSQFLSAEQYANILRDLVAWETASGDERRLIHQHNSSIYHNEKR